MKNNLKVAVSQFPVIADIRKNLKFIKKQIKIAAENEAEIIHFSECSLSAYAGIDFAEYTSDANQNIQKGIAAICEFAQLFNIWVIFGTHVFEGNMKKPFNCLFVINSQGEIVTRYDKRLLAGFDLDWYSAGIKPGLFEIKGIKCGLLICHEWRYPELYRQYYHLGVQMLFQSWYDGNYSEEEYREEGKNLGEVIPGFVRGNAANNKLWISGSNTCKKQQGFPAFICRPNGSLHGKLKRNISGVLIRQIDFDQQYSDLSSHLRDKVSRMSY
ncbi:carbon-nitrogen hydrolase family protein [uncultured Draconibacterium sp.]|uniref:carbon-nitrogen hydrolase family protein n=1 Tax=uncultured Draconibacterium sp. TaxID=1573823 RepID=UPI0032176E9C